ncbi:MAG: flagellar motor switch protein FliN [Leptospiraceae bacterium]|nr:flagellar motor switch protein FliN [Leptospiraceae bacterium]MDW8307606.1 flagellar motor switch protein FliN [Leptospiraceae bacterium]
MGDGSLSQEEIDALLMGAEDVGGTTEPFAASGLAGGATTAAGLSPAEAEILKDSFNEAVRVAGSQLSLFLENKSINIQCTSLDELPATSVGSQIAAGNVLVSLSLGSAKTLFSLPQDLAKRIARHMMGEPSEPLELNDAHLSTISEFINNLCSSLSNSLSGRFGENLTPTAPETKRFSSPADIPPFSENQVYRLQYNITIEGYPASRLSQYIDMSPMVRWGKGLSAGKNQARSAPLNLDFGGTPAAGVAAGPRGIPFTPVTFPSFQQSGVPSNLPPNLELLLDVQMVLTVELGRTKKYVKEILGLGEGSIIELDKLAGEPVDLLVNGKLIAKGEVVVIDENFGVRVTDIIGPAERLAKMSGG